MNQLDVGRAELAPVESCHIVNTWVFQQSWSGEGEYINTEHWPSVGCKPNVQFPRMTVIASAYSPEGFAIGADGMRRDLHGQVTTERAVKVFPIERQGLVGAHAWTGATALFYSDRQPFNFLDQAELVAQDMSSIAVRSASDYVLQFSQGLYDRLVIHHMGVPSNPNVFQTNEIVRGLFIGYIDDSPFTVEVSFQHRNGVFLEPLLTKVSGEPKTFGMFSGSESVLNDFKDDLRAPASLDDATNLVRRYIRSCVDNRNRYADCVNFGGRVHVAVVTPSKFEWADPPSAA
jgi:hypothetical protein